jgi:hypothetical protein
MDLDERAADLLASAVNILKSNATTFNLTDWRTAMTKATANANAKAMKAARPKIEAKLAAWPAYTPPNAVKGVDSAPAVCYNSGVGHDADTFTTNPQGNDMNKTPKTAAEKDAEGAENAAYNAELKAKKAADAAEKKAAAAAAKAAAAEAKAKKAAESAIAKEIAAAERAKIKAEKDAARAAKLAELRSDSKRTYFGSMLTLADRVKANAYVKGVNGQLRSNDDIAIALEGCSPANVVKLCTEVLEANDLLPAEAKARYAELNVGQQSMNLRNRLRGALKHGKITMSLITQTRDAGNYADAEANLAAKAEAKQAAVAAKQAAAAAKQAAKQAAKAQKEVATA